MADTFILYSLPEYPLWSAEMSPAAVAGHPYLTHVAPLGLFNPPGSGKVVRIKSIRIDPILFETENPVNNDNFVAHTMYRITAHVSSGDAIPYAELDSNNAALPSQVTLERYPCAVTTSGSGFDVTSMVMQSNLTRANADFWAADAWQNRLLRLDATTKEMQRITLREGEGIALTVPGLGWIPMRWLATITARVSATGACYRWNFPLSNIRGGELWSLLNGSGSGVVVEVVSIVFNEIGTDDMPQFAIEPIDQLDPDNGTALVPAALDSSGSGVGSVFARENSVYLMRGAKSGALISQPHMEWMVPVACGFEDSFNGFYALKDMAHWKPGGPYAPEFDRVLREGDGIAITSKTPSAYGRYRFTITFTVDAAVYPAVGDVDSGVLYGPTGDEYTGTLVQPAITDVKSGVAYGADGTEFTGTYAGGGGGGSGVSRSRVTNA